MRRRNRLMSLVCTATLAAACHTEERSFDEEQTKVDVAFAQLEKAVDEAPGLEPFLEIDHRRRGLAVGASMPPARVALFRAPALELTAVIANPKAAIEFPMRALVYGDPSGTVQMAYNSFEFVGTRHGLLNQALGTKYDGILERLAKAVDVPSHATALPTEEGDGLIVHDAEGTVADVTARLKSAVEEVDGAVFFGAIDYQAEAKAAGKDIPPLTLVLFGNPGAGAPAMADLPELGLDQFCQKVVIWEDRTGVHTAHNDVGWQAARRGGGKSLARAKVRLGLGATVGGAAKP